MAFLPALISVVSTVASTIGAIQEGKAAQEAAEYNAAVARNDAITARQEAQFEEDKHRQRVRRLLSTQRALYGKSGVTMQGSPLEVVLDTVEDAELDALAIRHGGKIKSQRFLSQARLDVMQGRAARQASYTRAGTSLLSGAGRTLNDPYVRRKLKIA